ncbi:MAG TPA: glycosyltransferase [Vicinamibacterales bacterium]|nr:glycosyltransferase [Vicinamibacterales bacterium]
MDAGRSLISVVIPCYNQARFLADAIGSARSDVFPVEVLVVDDGSTDGSADVAGGFSSVTLIRQENRGLAAARNRGLTASTGSFVIFLDADDELLPGGIDTAARALSGHRDCAMAYGRCVMMGPDGEFWPTPAQAQVRAGHFAAFLRTNPIWMPAMAIFRRDVLQALGGFREGFDAAADYDLYLRIAQERPIHDHGHRVAAYRRHPTALSGSTLRMLRETLAVMQYHRDDAERAGLLDTWRDGYAAWQDFYGTQLVEDIRTDVEAWQTRRAVGNGLELARLAPKVFTRELRRAIRRRYAGRAIPAAEI